MTEIKCENCGAIWETEYPLQGSTAQLVECFLCSREIPKNMEKPETKGAAPKTPPPGRQGSKKRGRPKSRPGPVSKPGKIRKQNKYPEEMVQFIKKNMNDFPNNELVTLVKRQFKIKIKKTQLAAYMNYKGLKRKKGAVKNMDGDEEDLKKLPPIDDF